MHGIKSVNNPVLQYLVLMSSCDMYLLMLVAVAELFEVPRLLRLGRPVSEPDAWIWGRLSCE
jgi:hypothetical protein